jgi:hypothetical protein
MAADRTMVASDSDFASIATKLADSKPDLLYIGAASAEAANIVLQAKQAAVATDINVMGPAGLGSDYIKAGGSSLRRNSASPDSGGCLPLMIADIGRHLTAEYPVGPGRVDQNDRQQNERAD